jgi:hypothetical protein
MSIFFDGADSLPDSTAWPLAASAQRRVPPVIGYLAPAETTPSAAFREGLKEVGYAEEQVPERKRTVRPLAGWQPGW